ncbi:MAG: ABC transporter permease [Tannerellaceae bacterium]|nr:ABC transporter permease [Tannerellaceae bacterium]
MFAHYIKTGIRNIRKNKQQVIIGMTGLVIGIICFSLCNYLVRNIWEVDRGFPNYKQLNTISWINGQGGGIGSNLGKARLLAESHIPGIEEIGVFTRPTQQPFIFELSSGQELSAIQEAMQVSEGLSKLLPFQWIHQSPHVFRQPNGIILTQTFAKKMYGNENPVGKQIRVPEQAEETRYTILGVIQDLPANNSLSNPTPADMFFCLDESIPNDLYCTIYALSSPGVKIETIAAILRENVLLQEIPEGRGGMVFYPQIRNAEETKKEADFIFSLFLVSMIGNLVLLAGLINFFSIFVGSFYNRTRELSLREVLGAGSYHHIQQLFTEIGIVMLMAFLFSLALSELLLPLVNKLFRGPGNVFDHTQIILHQIQYLPLFLLLCVLLSVLASYRLRKLVLIQGIKGGSPAGKKHIFRNCMLGFQFFISLIFFGAATAFHIQHQLNNHIIFSGLSKKEKERIYEVKLDYAELKGQEEVIKIRLAESRGVEDILESASRINGQTSISYYHPVDKEPLMLMNLETSPNFSSFMNIGLVEGHSPLTENTILVTESVAHYLEEERSTGTILLDQQSYQMAGVIKDFMNRTTDVSGHFAIKPVRQTNYLYVKAYPGYEQETAALIHQTVREWLPASTSFELQTLEEIIAHGERGGKEIRNIFLSIALLCLLITSLGIYSSITTDTNQRKKEVAIRKINGAFLQDIFWLFGKLYIKLLLIGTLFAFPLIWLLCRFLGQIYPESFNYNHPVFWFFILFVVLAVTAITISYRLLIIARINPAETVKSE